MKLNWITFAFASLALVAMVAIWKLLPQNPTALAVAGMLATGLTSLFPQLIGGGSSDGEKS